MKCFVGHQGEGEGFFGGGGDAEIVRGEDLNGATGMLNRSDLADMGRSPSRLRIFDVLRPYTQGGFELGHDERVFGAAAGDDELINFVIG